MNRVLLSLALFSALIVLTSWKPLTPDEGLVHWMTFEEAVAKSKTEPRKIFIDAPVIIQYYGEDYFQKVSWQDFQSQYQSPY